MVRKRIVITLSLVVFITLTFLGAADAQLDKLTKVACGSVRVGETYTFSPPSGHGTPSGHETYYWVKILTEPEGMRADIRAYTGGKVIDVFPVANKGIRIYQLNSDLSLEYVNGTADRLDISIWKAPYTVGPGGH